MRRRLAQAAALGFTIWQVTALGVALAHPEIFLEVYRTTLAAMGQP